MPASMTLDSTNGGLFTFSDIPQISRGVAHMRPHPSAPADRRKIIVTLSGFFVGNIHDEVMAQYEALKAVLADNKATWYYNDGNVVIANGPVYIQSLSEPMDWKQYDGNYTIAFSYFEQHTPNNPIVATFTPTGGSPLALHPTPAWDRSIKPNRAGEHGMMTTPSGLTIGSEVTINLQGSVVDTTLSTSGPAASSPAAVLARQTTFMDAFTGVTDGVLTYGGFSETCYIENLKFSPGVLENFTDYAITLKYYTEAVMQLSVKVSHPRVHQNPKIEERPYCGDRRITFGNTSGQEVTYSIRLKADTMAHARNLLADEAAALIVSGGIEWPGGMELWDYDANAVSVTIKKYYTVPILNNLVGT